MAEIRLGYLNTVTLLGRATTAPDLRYMPSGDAVLNFRIAVNRSYKDKNGEWVDDASFFTCVLWGSAAERAAERMKRGAALLVEGSLRSREWTEEKTGQKRSTVEVHAFRVQVLDKVAGASEPGEPEAPEAPARPERAPHGRPAGKR